MKHAPAMLASMPGTALQVMATACVPEGSLYRIIKRLHEAREIHIGGHEKHGFTGGPVPIYHAGPGVDVESGFKPRTKKQYNRAYIKRLKACGEHEHRLARARTRTALRRSLRKAPQQWWSALEIAA